MSLGKADFSGLNQEGIPILLRGLEVSMTRVSDKCGLGLWSKQRDGLKVRYYHPTPTKKVLGSQSES